MDRQYRTVKIHFAKHNSVFQTIVANGSSCAENAGGNGQIM